MTENMMNSAHKTSTELSRAGWDRTFGNVFNSKKSNKLRLVLFPECNRKCKGCVNDNYNMNLLPMEVRFEDYDVVMITGGEPMLKPKQVAMQAIEIKRQNPDAKVYVQTAKVDDVIATVGVLQFVDGLTLTLHHQQDRWNAYRLTAFMKELNLNKSMRCNTVKGRVYSDLPYLSDAGWIMKEIDWKDDCPLPEGEVLKRSIYFGGQYGNSS